MDAGPLQETSSQQTERVYIACPACGQVYRIAARLVGRRLACRNCRKEWRAQAVDVSNPSLAESAAGTLSADSDSSQPSLPEDLPPVAGSSSSIVDTKWAGR